MKKGTSPTVGFAIITHVFVGILEGPGLSFFLNLELPPQMVVRAGGLNNNQVEVVVMGDKQSC